MISTGENHSVREFCEIAFNQVGLNYRDYVRTDPKLVRPTEDTPLRGNSDKARSQHDWKPSQSFEDIVAEMVENDLQMLTN